MKELLIDALSDAIIKLNKITPQTKNDIKRINIIDVDPLDLPNFMKENNVPDNAYFDGRENGYDGWNVGEVYLSWDIEIPTTEKDKLKFRRNRFTSLAFKFVYDKLTTNGYKRVGFNSGLLKEFNNTTVYDMLNNNEFDRLVKYYSLSFKRV